MNYTQDEMIDLMEKVEAEGGDHLDLICKHKRYTFSGPHQKPLIWPGCGNSTLFDICYDLEPESNVLEQSMLTICAVDDAMAAWPRYGAKPHHEMNGGWLPNVEWLR